MSHNAYGQTYGHHVTEHVTVAKPDMGQNQWMGQAQHDHGHVQAAQEYFYGSSRDMASCHVKSEMKGDCHKKKNKSYVLFTSPI
ncbi:hypothetical protein L484_003876 [Morus notabilis]|uniref:Uncharacterized protein n=1 Tax=Morus notabilis TaxID=981085 RepID=W9RDC3_9ROSA|nr:hypothetical protein L484_003876 [Morus notabilis]